MVDDLSWTQSLKQAPFRQRKGRNLPENFPIRPQTKLSAFRSKLSAGLPYAIITVRMDSIAGCGLSNRGGSPGFTGAPIKTLRVFD